MLRPTGICSNVRQIDFGLLTGRQFDFGFFRRFLQTLQGQWIVAQINTLIFLELFDQVVDQAHVKVFTTEEGVTISRQHLDLVLAVDISNFNNGYIKGTATEVIHGDLAIPLFFIHTKGQCSSGRFIDNTLHFQTGNLASVLGGLTLGVIKIGWNGNHGFSDFFTQIIFRRLFHFLQDACGNFRWCHFFAIHFYPGVAIVRFDNLVGHHLDVFLDFLIFKAATNQPLDGEQGLIRIGDGLTLGRLSHQYFPVFGESHNRRGGAITFAVFNDLGNPVFHHCDAGVGGPQIDADNLTHYLFSPLNC